MPADAGPSREGFEVAITGLGAAGEGIARHDGKVVFVPGALPGERVRVEIVRSGVRFDRARLVEVLEARGRRETPCPHDHPGGCGGCSLLHATREAQADAKRIIVRDALARIGRIAEPPVRATEVPGPDLGYRNHARFGVDPGGRLTFVARAEDGARGDGRGVLAIETCAVLHPRLDELRAILSGKVAGAREVELRIGARTGDRLAIVHGVAKCPPGLDPSAVDASIALSKDGRLVPLRGAPEVREDVLGHRFRISASSFFQVNTDGAERLATLARDFVGPTPLERALDLYAGVGLFTVAALGSARRIVAVEIDPASAEDFRHNAPRDRAQLRMEAAEDALRDLRPGRDVFEVAIVNPPRAGLGDAVIGAFAPLRVPRLVIVSCDPGSLARDVASLARAGYQLRDAVPVDQFPGTAHVETVALLDRRL
jgi:23S rRNA (uracil1939-C5)-methyltransferase